MSISAPPRKPDATPRTDVDDPPPIEHEAEFRPEASRSVRTSRVRALIEEAWRRTGRRRVLIASAAIALSVGVVALALGALSPTELPDGVPERSISLGGRSAAAPATTGENGTLATVATSTADAPSDIYLLESGSTVPRQLTSTPEFDEYAPAWSPDGTMLAYIRSDPPDDEQADASIGSLGFAQAAACVDVCELVIADGATGVPVLSSGIGHAYPRAQDGFDRSMVPSSIAWAPDGKSIIVNRSFCGIGGCGGTAAVGSVLVDVETARTVEIAPGLSVLGWSPDGRWLAVAEERGVNGHSVVAVPTGALDESALADPPERDGWIVLSDTLWWANDIGWAADSSTVFLNEGRIFGPGSGEQWRPATIDAVTVPDRIRHTVIADGAGPLVSPDGRHLAYHTDYGLEGDDGILTDIWVADIDGAGALRIAENATADSWSPDGRLLVAHDDRSWFTIASDGTSRTDLAVRATGDGVPWGPTASWQRLPATE